MTPRPQETHKDRLLADIAQVRNRILVADERDEVFLGTWSIKDLLAHLIGWDYANARACHEILAGEMPAFYAHEDRGWQTYNAMLVREHRRDDLEELLEAARASHEHLLDTVRGLPNAALERTPSGRRRPTIGSLLRLEVRDELEHLKQVKAWQRAKRTRA